MKRLCPICDDPRSALLFTKNGYDIVRCGECNFQFVDDVFDGDFVREFYTDDFFKDGHDKYGYADYVGDKRNHLRAAKKRVRIIEQHAKGGSLLDVGCAAGFFLESLGPTWEPHGLEPCREMARLAQEKFGDRITLGTFEDFDPQRTFDVITMWDVLEHVVHPRSVIQKAHALLSPGGHLFIGTPAAESPAAKILGKHWYYYVPPAHINFFDRWTIKTLLERSGFRCKSRLYLPKLVSLSEIVLNLSFIVRSEGLRRFSEKIALSHRWNVSVPYMAYDDLFVVAQKEPA